MGFIARSDGGEFISEYWHLCDVLSVKQAALLVVGIDPASEAGTFCEGWKANERPSGYEAAKLAIGHALNLEIIKGEHHEIGDQDNNGSYCAGIPGTIDIDTSTVNVASLVEWLKIRGVKRGFLFSIVNDGPEYLDPKHPRYAPKLAAAVFAWKAVRDPQGKSPKGALQKWLRENAAQFGMTDEDGSPINQAVDDCAKVANWQPGGGAAKTPGADNPPTPKA